MKFKNRILKALLSILIAFPLYGFAQKPNGEVVVGYGLSNEGYRGVCDFTFYPDSTFDYSGFSGHRHSSGTWYYKNNNTIVLNSHMQERKTAMEYQIERAGLEKTIMEVRVHAEEDINPKEYICTPYYLMDDFLASPRYIHPDRGSYEIVYSNKAVLGTYFEIERSFLLYEMRFYGFGGYGWMEDHSFKVVTDTIQEESSPGDRITVDIYIDDSLFTYEVFTNKEIKVRKNKIVFTEPFNDKKEHIYLNDNVSVDL